MNETSNYTDEQLAEALAQIIVALECCAADGVRISVGPVEAAALLKEMRWLRSAAIGGRVGRNG
jgi:hypothetical protein